MGGDGDLKRDASHFLFHLISNLGIVVIGRTALPIIKGVADKEIVFGEDIEAALSVERRNQEKRNEVATQIERSIFLQDCHGPIDIAGRILAGENLNAIREINQIADVIIVKMSKSNKFHGRKAFVFAKGQHFIQLLRIVGDIDQKRAFTSGEQNNLRVGALAVMARKNIDMIAEFFHKKKGAKKPLTNYLMKSAMTS